MTDETVKRIKQSVRIKHNKLDDDVRSDIDGCLADLKVCGVINLSEDDALIFNAIKLFCKAANAEDVAKSQMWMERYNSLKACLMMAEGYGYPAEAADDE